MQKKYKKLMTAAATATLVATLIVPVVSAASFSDTAGNTHEAPIDALVDLGIISGYPDGTFKPNRTLTRSDVVKLLGKYLVTQGYSVPSDYKMNMRFNDLTPRSQDELLKYAALVKDANVFNGSSGNLLPNDNITRENMAVVLVRAYSEINDFDFVSYVGGLSFPQDVQDLNRAKAEARSAIRVLDYYGVTGVRQFNPKSFTTRGQFSSFLFKMMQVEIPKKDVVVPLTLKSAEVTGTRTLRVILSDDSVHTVTLQVALEENSTTSVTFTINGNTYTTTVTYAVAELKVSSVTAVTGTQFAIKFNQPVRLPASLNAREIANYVTLTGVDNPGIVTLGGANLSTDGRTLMVQTTGGAALAGRYVVKVKDVRNAANTTLTPYDQVVSFSADKTAPVILGATNTDAKTVEIRFSEAMQAYANGNIQFRLANNTPVTGITGSLAAFSTVLQLDLTNARVNGQALTANVPVYATFTGARDIAGNIISPNPAIISFSIGGMDGVKPTVQDISQTGPKTFKLTFSERVVTPNKSDFVVRQGRVQNAVASITPVQGDNRSYFVEVVNNLAGLYNIETARNAFIQDISGETNTIALTYTFTLDTVAPIVTSYQLVKPNNDVYLELVFDKEVYLMRNSTVKASGYFIENRSPTPFTGNQATLSYVNSNSSNIVRVKLADLLNNFDRTDALYDVTLTFANVLSVNNINANEKSVTFTRQADANFNRNVLEAPIVRTSVNDSNLTNNEVKLLFNHPVDETSGNNKVNYTIEGAVVANASVNRADKREVTLTLAQGETSSPGVRNLEISNVRAENSLAIQPNIVVAIDLKENIKPTVTAAASAGEKEVLLTFSEAIVPSTISNTSFIVEVNRLQVDVSNATMQSNNTQVLLEIPVNKDYRNRIRIKAGSTVNAVKDISGNVLDFTEISYVE